MDEKIQKALASDQTIDITTIGCRSGREVRIEIWYHYLDGKIYITGLPGKRDWYANMLVNPHFTFHLKESLQADLPATAFPIKQAQARREVLARITENLDRSRDLDAWIAGSPLVEVRFS